MNDRVTARISEILQEARMDEATVKGYRREDYLCRLEPGAERVLLMKSWMTHDAMWFYHTLSDEGIEKANEINLKAMKSMAAVEARRIRQAFKIDHELDTFERLKEYLYCGFALYSEDFMGFQLSFPEHNVCWLTMPGCFAYEGVKRLGAIEQYKCGPFVRATGWLEALGVQFEIMPELSYCRKHHEGICSFVVVFSFPDASNELGPEGQQVLDQ